MFLPTVFVVTVLFSGSLVNCAVTTTLRPSENEAFIITTVIPEKSESDLEINNDVGSPTTVLPISAENSGDDSASDYVVTNLKSKNSKTQKTGEILKPEIRSFKIQSDIRYRYSRTYVTSRVVNPNENSTEISFRVVLPDVAFISKFVMEIDGKAYVAYVKEKEEAKNIYNTAQSQGQSAGLVELNTRNSNVFNVNVNVAAKGKVNFNLTYEELLQRRLGHYEQSINVSPEQFTNVKDFQIIVNIEESQNITLLRVPQLRNDVEAQEDVEGNNKDAVIERPAGNKATISWKPSKEDQEALSKQGITGKFVVQYDIKRELDAGEVLVMNGYFVHFFAPANLAPLRKHVVFILDVSGSMWGRKIEQLKEAMSKILADLNSDDFFNIITFSSDVTLWGPEDKLQADAANSWTPPSYLTGNSNQVLDDAAKRQPFPATKENIEKAQSYIKSLVASGGTNIHDSIVQALNLTSLIKKARKSASAGLESVSTSTEINNASTTTTTSAPAPESKVNLSNSTEGTVNATNSNSTSKPINILPKGVESLIIFLTDGEPTVGVTNPTQIQTLIQTANKNDSIPIFSLAFGEGADFPFVRKLSLQNNGFARKIYEASDAALQLKGFYNEIASPLLSHVKFNYTSPDFEVGNLTTTKFVTVFGGTEIVVGGSLVPKPGVNGNSTTTPSNSTIVLNNATGTDAVPPSSTTTPTPIVSSTDPSSTEFPRLEDSLALPAENADAHTIPQELVPTKQLNFQVLIDGHGRNGDVQFINPEIFSSPIPWGVPVVTPWPPRPTPPPTQEDTFLEKMWAYLTIKQLIDQDLATIAKDDKDNMIDDLIVDEQASTSTTTTTTTPSPSVENNNVTVSNASATTVNSTVVVGNTTVSANVTDVKETPKQRALRLALKYGFVTPLTSLVVVKPNKTDVTDAVSTDSKPETVDSMSAPQSMAISFIHAAHKTAPVKFVATANRISSGGFNSPPLPLSIQASRLPQFPGFQATHLAPPMQFIPAGPEGFISSQPDYSNAPESNEELANIESVSTTAKIATTTPKAPTLDNNSLSLKNLTWLSGDSSEISYNETVVLKIAINETEDELKSFVKGNVCQVEVNKEKKAGTCQHLRDCVQTAILSDQQLYKDSYLCPIQSSSSSGVTYAGVCCPNNVSVSVPAN